MNIDRTKAIAMQFGGITTTYNSLVTLEQERAGAEKELKIAQDKLHGINQRIKMLEDTLQVSMTEVKMAWLAEQTPAPPQT